MAELLCDPRALGDAAAGRLVSLVGESVLAARAFGRGGGCGRGLYPADRAAHRRGAADRLRQRARVHPERQHRPDVELRVSHGSAVPVSYTHLTLPTSDLV